MYVPISGWRELQMMLLGLNVLIAVIIVIVIIRALCNIPGSGYSAAFFKLFIASILSATAYLASTFFGLSLWFAWLIEAGRNKSFDYQGVAWYGFYDLGVSTIIVGALAALNLVAYKVAKP